MILTSVRFVEDEKIFKFNFKSKNNYFLVTTLKSNLGLNIEDTKKLHRIFFVKNLINFINFTVSLIFQLEFEFLSHQILKQTNNIIFKRFKFNFRPYDLSHKKNIRKLYHKKLNPPQERCLSTFPYL